MFVEIILYPDIKRLCDGPPLFPSLVRRGHVASTKALGPLWNIMKYIVCEYEPWKRNQQTEKSN